MFTLEQIENIHARLGRAKTLTEYARALMALGVERYVFYLADGHSACLSAFRCASARVSGIDFQACSIDHSSPL